MIAYSFFFLLLALPLLVLGLMLVWYVTRSFASARRRWIWSAILLPPAGLVALLSLWIIWISFAPASVQFYRIFRLWPDGSIVRIESEAEHWRGSGQVFLRFNAPAPRIDRIIERGFYPTIGLPDSLSTQFAPDWWRLEACPTVIHHYAATRLNGWPNLVLAYCRETGQTLVEADWGR